MTENLCSATDHNGTHRTALEHDLALIWQTHSSEPLSSEISRSSFKCHGSVRIGYGSGGAVTGMPPEHRIYLHGTIHSEDPLKDESISIRDYCVSLVAAATDEDDHFARIDRIYGRLVGCVLTKNGFQSNFSSLVGAAQAVLTRLPETPVEFRDERKNYLQMLPLRYFKPQTSNTVLNEKSWEQLLVAATFNTNVLRLALFIACTGPVSFHPAIRRLIDTTADLLETLGDMQREAVDDFEASSIFVTRAFLWSSWQRLSMMMLWQSLRGHLTQGLHASAHKDWSMKGSTISSNVFEHSGEGHPSRLPPYMCPWAFRSLCVERSAATFDFRRFHQRFREAFGSRAARCMTSGALQCDGKAATNCQRFKGATIIDQSAHDELCLGLQHGCRRLYWNEKSYRSVQGAKAVCIFSSQSDLRYCSASNTTLAISHVWSHGQGGRPEQNPFNKSQGGMNLCLHRRYSALAEKMGCDSYWMDTPCIPQDHGLRREAIEKINPVFEDSKATLICDRDLMDLDVSRFTSLKQLRGLAADQANNSTYDTSVIHLLETLLVVLLVADWNVRAWTLLEAARGRHNIYILCARNDVISLYEALCIVSLHGAVEIAILYQTDGLNRRYGTQANRKEKVHTDISTHDGSQERQPSLPSTQLEFRTVVLK